MKRKLVPVLLFVVVVGIALSSTTISKTAEIIPPEPLGIIAYYK